MKQQVRVLFVDDSDADSVYFNTIARDVSPGMVISLASSAYQALQILDKAFPLPHAVVIDVNLSGMTADGHELAKDIRGDARWSHIPVFTISGAEGAEFVKDVQGKWALALCGVIVRAAASHKPGPMEVLHEGYRALSDGHRELAGRLDSVEATVGVHGATIEEGRGVVTAMGQHMNEQHAEVMDAIKRGSRIPSVVVGLLCSTVVALAFIATVGYITTGMNVNNMVAKYRDLQFNVGSEAAPLDARIESDGTDWDYDTLETRPQP